MMAVVIGQVKSAHNEVKGVGFHVQVDCCVLAEWKKHTLTTEGLTYGWAKQIYLWQKQNGLE